jgi:hypothetical protein
MPEEAQPHNKGRHSAAMVSPADEVAKGCGRRVGYLITSNARRNKYDINMSEILHLDISLWI